VLPQFSFFLPRWSRWRCVKLILNDLYDRNPYALFRIYGALCHTGQALRDSRQEITTPSVISRPAPRAQFTAHMYSLQLDGAALTAVQVSSAAALGAAPSVG
jgi:hypothetical protein